MHEAGKDADWRTNRLTTAQFLERQLLNGRRVSPIFKVFGVFIWLFRLDWLHIADLGVAADFIGNFFEMVLSKMPGTTREARAAEIWKEMQKFYVAGFVADRMKSFDCKNFQASGNNPPKLRGTNAASMRALVPFVKQLADDYLHDAVPLELSAKHCAHHLQQCYQSLSATSRAMSDDVFLESSIQFVNHFYAMYLARGDGLNWRVKPKMHLFLELCAEGTSPSLFWCYRDEDFGGTVAKLCRMRGTWKQLKAYSIHGLDMFMMQNDPPRLV